ncbi:hypothetical protein BJS_08973 [Bradyrhizobium japonicum SEMIA 5079]|nr:hypothetical protein BJS_08973 [Bradyrhizobium japonicum SEMIA 5079]
MPHFGQKAKPLWTSKPQQEQFMGQDLAEAAMARAPGPAGWAQEPGKHGLVAREEQAVVRRPLRIGWATKRCCGRTGAPQTVGKHGGMR